MNNIKRSELLFDAAQECYLHALSSFDRQSWNMCIRRAQEAVELKLTGLLARIAIHYPKDHDQAPILFRVLQAKGINTSDFSPRIEFISADLSRKRGPALHQEEGYDKETATEAIKNVEFVFENSNIILQRLSQKGK